MAMSVSFGETPAFDIVVTDENTLTCTVPAHAAGTVDVVVASSTSSDGLEDAYTYVDVPEITSVNPDTAPVGEATFYTVNGNNLPAETDPQAWFVSLEPDGEPIPLDVVYTNGFPTFSLTASTAGTYDLWVEDGSGTEIARLNAAVTITAAAAVDITGITPTTAEPGVTTDFTVTGTNLDLVPPTMGVGWWFVSGEQEAVPSVSSATAESVTLTVFLTEGVWDVVARDAEGNELDRLDAAVTIIATLPTLETVTPLEATQGVSTAYTFTGTGLLQVGNSSDDPPVPYRLRRYLNGSSSGSGMFISSSGHTDTQLVTGKVSYGSTGSLDWAITDASGVEVSERLTTTLVAAVQAVEPAEAPVRAPVEFTATGTDLDQFTGWGVALDTDPETPDVEPTVPVLASSSEPVDETTVSFTVELPVAGTYNIVATDSEGEQIVVGPDLVIGDPTIEVPE